MKAGIGLAAAALLGAVPVPKLEATLTVNS